MFRRPGKNPLDENKILYEEESSHSSLYGKYGSQKVEPPSRIFDPPHPQHAQRSVSHEHQEENWGSAKAMAVPHHFEGMLKEEAPETTLGEGVTFRGELSFERLLRIDGEFEGSLLSQGKVIVGPKGKVKADLNLREAIIEGHVEGNITVQEKLELRGGASIKGDVIAKALCVDEGVQLDGHVLVASTPPPSEE